MEEKSCKIKTVYHYCSLETFYNILKNGTIRLSDICKSNDSNELKILKDKLYQAFFEAYKNYHDEVLKHANSYSMENADEALSFINSTKETREFLTSCNNFIIQENEKPWNRVWGICFSEADDLLSQWRGYADNACGISIGFSIDLLHKIGSSISENSDCYFQFGKVLYQEDEISESLYNNVPFKDINIHSTKEDIEKLYSNYFKVLIKDCAFAKNEGFSEEREWRLILNDFSSDENTDNFYTSLSENFKNFTDFNINSVDFVIKNGTLASYVELKISNMRNAISEIVIGPKSKCTIDDIREFLIFCGLLKNREDDSITIRKSRLSFR